MVNDNKDLISRLMAGMAFFTVHQVPEIARAPGALRAEFLITPLPDIAGQTEHIKTYLDVMMFNDFWLSRMLSSEGLFNSQASNDDLWAYDTNLQSSVVGYIVRYRPNELLGKVITEVPEISSFLDRPLNDIQGKTVFDLLVMQRPEHNRKLNINLLNTVFVKLIDNEGSVLTDKRFSQFVQALVNTSESDLVRSIGMTGIKSALQCAAQCGSVPVFVDVSAAKLALGVIGFDLNFAPALFEQNIDMQVVGANEWLTTLPPAAKSKVMHILDGKLESIRQISDMQLNMNPAAGRDDYVLLNACVCALNNYSSITNSQLNDDVNFTFLHELTKQTNLLIKRGLTEDEADALYQGRSDKAALYVKAMIAHHRTKTIFDSILFDDVFHIKSADLDC